MRGLHVFPGNLKLVALWNCNFLPLDHIGLKLHEKGEPSDFARKEKDFPCSDFSFSGNDFPYPRPGLLANSVHCRMLQVVKPLGESGGLCLKGRRDADPSHHPPTGESVKSH